MSWFTSSFQGFSSVCRCSTEFSYCEEKRCRGLGTRLTVYNLLIWGCFELALNHHTETIQDPFLRNSSTNFLFLILFHLGKFNLNTHKFVTSGNEALLGRKKGRMWCVFFCVFFLREYTYLLLSLMIRNRGKSGVSNKLDLPDDLGSLFQSPFLQQTKGNV